MAKHNVVIAALLLCLATSALADEPPICPDRPTKSNGPCTVPEGKWQVETGLIDWTSSSSGGVRTETAAFGSAAIKYGVGPNIDIELLVTPLETLSVHGGGNHEHHSSFGDTSVRVKYRISKEGAPIQIALDPFVKVPTANHQLGNGKVEGGLLVPIQVSLGKSPFSISLEPEVDLLANQDGGGHHAAMIQLVGLGWQASKKLTLAGEIWGQWDWDPAGTNKQASWDGAIAYLVNNDLQLDAGANFGLNKQTPDVELYTGVSIRFR